MGSAFNGFIVGALAAAYLGINYGDQMDKLMAGMTGSLASITAYETATPAGQPLPDVQPPDPQESMQALPAPVDPVSPDLSLEQRWASFAATPPQLPGAAEFPWRHCFRRAAASHDLPEPLLLAVASGESGFDPAARSAMDAIGLMQIRWPQTGKHLGIYREADLYDPCTNVEAGTRYLKELLARFDNNLHRALAAYNYGPGRIDDGAMPEGARWYSQYIYQHLQQVLGEDHVPTSELLRPGQDRTGGHLVLMQFSRPQRARDFINHLQNLVPGLELRQRSEALGQQEVVVLYRDQSGRERALASLAEAGLAPLLAQRNPSHTL